MKFVPKQLEETADVSRGKSSCSGWLKTLVSGALSLVLLYLALGLIADLVAASVSEETEAKWFAWAEPDAAPGASPDMARAQTIFARLSADPELRPLPYRLHLIADMAEPNAFAFPGGAVGITAALLAEVKSERGLALVLAHELGHHQHRHSLKRLGRTILHQVALATLFGDAGSAIERSASLAELGYSRAQETEADAFGLSLVHRNYGDTVGSLEFFVLLEKKRRAEGGSQTPLDRGLLSSHPMTTDRLTKLRALQKALAAARNPAPR